MDIVHVDILDFYGKEMCPNSIVKNVHVVFGKSSIGLSFVSDNFYDISGIEYQLIDDEMCLLKEKKPYNIPLFGIKYGFDDKIDFWKERELLLEFIKTQNVEMKKNCEKLLCKIYWEIKNLK